MNSIDLRTVVLLGGIISGLMALVMHSIKLSYPSTIKGLAEWSTALLLVFIGTTLGAFSQQLPVFLGVSIPRLLILIGLYLIYVGSQRFLDVAPQFKAWIIFLVGVTLLQFWFTFIQPSFQIRLALSNLMAMYLFGIHAILLHKRCVPSFAKGMAVTVLACMSAIQILRFGAGLFWPAGDSIFDNSPIQVIYVTSFMFCILLLSISILLLAADRLHTELEHLATHDSLTNALTRRQMNTVCQHELERCRRHGRSLAVLIMDIDHFKAINDTVGHQGGDRVLVNFVNMVNGLLRQPDQLGRFGGEEFMLLLPETSLEEALCVAERIRLACEQTELKPAYTVSIGATTNRQDTDTIDSLVARADAALYRAKANGRNRIETA